MRGRRRPGRVPAQACAARLNSNATNCSCLTSTALHTSFTLPSHFPCTPPRSVSSEDGAGLVVYERQYALSGSPTFRHGYVEDSPLLPAPPEVFRLRKLLPATEEYDFNMHVMVCGWVGAASSGRT
eukprot:362399-Chlamydomonas_euryale.AAC.5